MRELLESTASSKQKKGVIAKPETWPKKASPDACLCGEKQTWHQACYRAKASVRIKQAHGIGVKDEH